MVAALPSEVRRRGQSRSRMADVARLAAVSTATVSRALRQPEVVSEELRSRIGAAIERLAYRPNLMAGGLATARSRTVGVIVPSIINSFFAATVEEMAETLSAEGYQLMLGNSNYSAEAEEALLASFLAWSPAGIVLTGRQHSRAALRRLLETDVPVVEMWDLGERPLDCLVGFSHREVGKAVAAHFIAAGATRFGFVGAALDRDHRAADRGAGFREAVAAAGLAPPAEIARPERASTVAGGAALRELIGRAPGTEAVFFSNDVLALGALFECQRQGLAVPDRLRLCGFGDLDFAAASVPTLTTVRPPRREIGRRIADLLVARFAGQGGKGEIVDLGFQLIARESG
jgi:LacI family gluconate utilization system Gnt-I transcriptional repressor